MELDQLIFKKVYDFTKSILSSKPDEKKLQNTAYLSDLKDRLSIFTHSLTGKKIEILPAVKEGGLLDNKLFLPQTFDHFNNIVWNTNFYFYRACYLGTEMKVKESNQIINKLEYTKVLINQMIHDYPKMKEVYETIYELELEFYKSNKLEFDPSYLYGKIFIVKADSINKKSKGNISESNSKNSEITTEIKGKPIEEINVIELDKKSMEDYTLSHNFEKVETAEEFNGNWRDLDGTDEVALHEDAMNELNLKDVIRSDDPVHSVYSTEFFSNSNAPDVEEVVSKDFFINYDEWDFKKRVYKKDHCKVYPSLIKKENSDYYKKVMQENQSVLKELRIQFSKIYNELETVTRQSEGEEPDIEILIENYSEIRAGKTPSENIYLSKRKKRHDISVLILIDLSLSTDSFVENNRIIDVEKQSILLFCEVLNEFGDNFQIDGFSSRTRNHCDYFTIKSFEDPWIIARNHIGAIEPVGYTRIGPAIRHSIDILKNQPSNKKWLIILSDGKPSDYDKYEGQYGMEDVRQSILEAEKHKIHTFAFAVEKSAKAHLSFMMGEGKYKILTNPQLLPKAFSELYHRIV